MQTLARSSSTRRRSPAVDVSLAVLIGLAAALAKRYLDFHLGIPGHAGVGWIAVLVFGRLINRRPPMGVIAGLSMGLWGIPVGLGHSIGYNVLLYGLAGAVLDSSILLRLPLQQAWGATLAGTAVHVAKYGFIFANAWISAIVRRVEVFGFLAALANHVVFGALGGLAGWTVWRLGRRVPRFSVFRRRE